MNPIFYDSQRSLFTFSSDQQEFTITDPYAGSEALGVRLKDEDSFRPFLHFFHPQKASANDKRTGRADLEVLVYITKFGGFHLWLCNRSSPGSTDLLRQLGLSLQQLNQLCILLDGKELSELLARPALQQAISTLPDWAQSAIEQSCLSQLPLQPGGHTAAGGEFLELLEQLFEFSHPTDHQQLLAEIEQLVPANLYPSIASLFGAYLDLIASNNSTSILMEARHCYCMLRELFGMITGHHIVKDPLSGRHVISLKQRNLTSGPLTPRLILYRSAANDTAFEEVRSFGFMDTTDSFIFKGGLSYEIASWAKWGDSGYFNREDLLALIHDDFATADRLPSPDLNGQSHRVVVSTVTGDVNLGHIIWNEFSGLTNLATIIEQCQPLSLPPIQIFLPGQSETSFARVGPRTVLGKKFQQTWASLASDQFTFIEQPEQRFQGDDVIHVSFRAWLVSKQLIALMKELADDYRSRHPETETDLNPATASREGGLNILLNSRTRDKSCLNLDRCLDVALAQLNGTSAPAYPQIRFFLDYVDSHETVDACIAVLERYGCQIALAPSSALDQLAAISDRADLAIVPVGSGAVVPTWIFRKPSIMHAEKSHMHQIYGGMWFDVSDFSRDDIYTFDANTDIREVGDGREGHQGAYCNYLLDEQVFADRFLQIIAKLYQPSPPLAPA